MSGIRVVSIIPYKILPARLGGEKGIAVFNEYVGTLIPITAIGTRNNEIAEAKNYKILNLLSNSRLRYINIFLYFTIRSIIKREQATHLLIEHPYYGWLAWLLKKTMSITWVVHSHNIEFERSKSIGRWWWKALKWYEQWVYKKADFNFFISEDDRHFAIDQLRVSASKSFAITYGVEIPGIPADLNECKQEILRRHSIHPGEKILLFNGALYHHTNYHALQVILDIVNPILLKQPGLSYKIIVCGRGLPDFFNELKEYTGRNIIYAGFVDDISIYFKAADLFLNPIISGGGVKTKAIEAIAYNCPVVSTRIGALGIVQNICGSQLKVVEDNDWKEFANQVLESLTHRGTTPEGFYQYYYWKNIAQKVVTILNRNG